MRRCARRAASAAALAVFLLLATVPAWAAPNPQQQAESVTGWIYRWLNFLIFFGAIAYMLYRYSPPYFRRRREAIVQAIAESTLAREEAERLEREAEAKLADLEREVAGLRGKAKQEGAAEVERIRALAQEEAKRVEQAARLEIRAAERSAQTQLIAIAARLAVERAEALLRQQVTPRAESALFQEFLMDLGRSVN